MKSRKWSLLSTPVFVIALLSSWGLSSAFAQDVALRGLPGLLIRVELNKTLVGDGMQKRPIYMEVEDKLRETGIKIFTEKQWREAAGHPQLYIEVNASKVRDNWPFFTFSVNVHLMQDVYIMRDNQTALHQASIWFRSSAGHGYSRDIRARIIDMVEVFSAAYIEANQ
jgi:hypothetical protein